MSEHQYQNPIPSLDDETQSRQVHITFNFEKPVTTAEAADNINEWLKTHSITPKMVFLSGHIGIRYAQIQNILGEDDSDPEGYGPR